MGSLEQKLLQLGIQKDIEDLGKELAGWIEDDKKHISDWRKSARECYAFDASDQWADEEKAVLAEKNRPAVVFNRGCRTINAVAGLEIQNRQEVRYIPREMGDVGVNELLTGAAKWARDNCDAGDEESESFRDLLISGMGWTETRMDYEQDPEGMIVVDRLDPLEMGWDCSSKKKNLDDARRVWRAKELTVRDVKEQWPGSELEPTDFWGDADSNPHVNNETKYDGKPTSNDKNPAVVVQIQWWERRNNYKVLTENGVIADFSQEKWEKIQEYVEEKGLRYQKTTTRAYIQAFVSGEKILDIMPCPCDRSFTFRCMTGIRDRNKSHWFGLWSLMIDPQRWANKWLSQIMHILNSNAKGGLLVEDGATDNVRELEDKWAASDSVIHLNPGGLQKIQEKGQNQYPNGIDRLMTYAVDSIPDTAGVSLEFMGIADRMQAGYLEAQRKQSSISVLAPYFDGLRRYRKEQGRVLAHFIVTYLADGRLVRIAGDSAAQYVPLLRDRLTLINDVVVDDAPTSPNMKEKTFAILIEILPIALQSGIPVPPDILDFAPLPEGLAQKWRKYIEANSQPDPMAERAKQIALAGEAAKVQETGSKTVLNFARAQESGASVNLDSVRVDTERQNATVQAFKAGADAANPDRGML